MAVDLRFLTTLVRRDDVESGYPGGAAAFEQAFALRPEDGELYAFVSMSGDDADLVLDRLVEAGFDLSRVAVGDMSAGPIEEAPGIVFECREGDHRFPAWTARAVDRRP